MTTFAIFGIGFSAGVISNEVYKYIKYYYIRKKVVKMVEDFYNFTEAARKDTEIQRSKVVGLFDKDTKGSN